MELLQHFLPDSQQIRLERWYLEPDAPQVRATVFSTPTMAECPVCEAVSRRVPSRSARTLADLALALSRLTLPIQVRPFFGLNAACMRRLFTERLPALAAPGASKTVRLVQRLQSLGLALGGAAGTRLAHQLGQLPLPHFKTPKLLGVDDFAFRQGRQSGTIWVDLEQHRPLALLADRKAETLAEWLRRHPGVEVLSQERSKV